MKRLFLLIVLSSIIYAQLWADASMPLNFTAVNGPATVKLVANGTPPSINLRYSVDNCATWNTYTIGNTISLVNGAKVYFKALNTNATFSTSMYMCYKFQMTGTVSSDGNIMSLLDATMNQTSVPGYAFRTLFYGCTSLIQAPSLPATTLASYCYSNMFYGCTSLTQAPALPATTLASYCYSHMFNGCTSLTQAPALPATTLADYCYGGMFNGCTSLTQAPALPATTLANYCYQYMFNGCTSLTQAPSLSATTLANYCCQYMFNGCTSLTQAPALPATTLANYCYQYMFNGCTSLTRAPSLSATTLAIYCCQYMFNGCTSLTQAPSLPATTLAGDCYRGMFCSCTSLTQAPSLPATTLAYECYQNMFNGCTSLTQAPALPATTLANYCYQYMFNGCTSLTQAPSLPATTLAYECYQNMFSGCTSLTQAPALPATNLEWNCYSYMFFGCTSLTQAPVLPASTLAGGCYQYMFYGCTSLTQAPALPATNLERGCYSHMFFGCTSLTQAPSLPATTLAFVYNYCYYGMFKGCTSLTQAPSLPATTLAEGCYSYMFDGCTSLTQAPSLPATTLAEGCYASMFSGCSSLTQTPLLPATDLYYGCYASMFSGCSSLTQTPLLPATDLDYGCYASMFSGCTSLTQTPSLPATTLADSCYASMFSGCSSLTTIPYLPATELTEYCYSEMFSGCTSIAINRNSPGKSWLIYATNRYRNSINGMFDGTSGSMKSTPSVNTLYYIASDTLSSIESLCFMAISAGTGIKLDLRGGFTETIQTSTTGNDSDWTNYSSGTVITLTNAGDRIYFRAANNHSQAFGKTGQGSSKFTFTGDVVASGNIMSLYGPDCPNIQLPQYAFKGMFENCASLWTAPELPATDLASNCYEGLFRGCSSLKSFAELPATTLSPNCYSHMFEDCISLKYAPALPATTTSDSCYANMFKGCVKLLEMPVLPASVLSPSCYNSMFMGCNSLLTAQQLSATTLADSCYAKMFSGCMLLKTLPALNASTLMPGCYYKMFENCYAIVLNQSVPGTPWVISASTTVQGAVDSMFVGTAGNVNGTPAVNTTYYFVSDSIVTSNPLYFTALSAGATVKFSLASRFTETIQISRTNNGTDWVNYVSDSVIILNNVGDKVYFRAANQHSQSFGFSNGHLYDSEWSKFILTGDIAASGNIMSLYGPNCPDTPLPSLAMSYLFSDNTTLVSAPSLPATTLAFSCYSGMFRNCHSLVSPPSILPAMNLAGYCYENMFDSCISLMTTPILPAMNLYASCYSGMFADCESLTVAPELPALTLADECYEFMFSNCTNLKSIPVLSATILKNFCYRGMFNGCRSLIVNSQAPGVQWIIPADSVGYYSLLGMFSGTGGTMNGTPSANTPYYLVTDVSYRTITANSNDTTMGRVSGSGNYPDGHTVVIIAKPKPHYHFVSWDNGATTDTLIFVANGDTTITATFAPDTYSVTGNSNHVTMGSVAGSGLYDYGDTATLIAISNQHYHFVSWSNGATTDTLTIEVSGDSVLTANFAIDQHTLTVNSNDSTMGSVTGGGTYNYGQTVTIIATPNVGHHFVSWSNGSLSDSIAINVTSDTTLTATFEADALNGTIGDNLHWSLDTITGELLFSGSGSIPDYSASLHAPWYYNSTFVKYVTMPAGTVSRVGDYAFDGCGNLFYADLHADTLGANIFNGCTSLALCYSQIITHANTLTMNGCTTNPVLIANSYQWFRHSYVDSLGLAVTLYPYRTDYRQDSLLNINASVTLHPSHKGISVVASRQDINGTPLHVADDCNIVWKEAKVAPLVYKFLLQGVGYIGKNSFAGCTGTRDITVTPKYWSSTGSYGYAHLDSIHADAFDGTLPDIIDLYRETRYQPGKVESYTAPKGNLSQTLVYVPDTLAATGNTMMDQYAATPYWSGSFAEINDKGLISTEYVDTAFADVYFYYLESVDSVPVEEYRLILYKIGGSDTADVRFSNDTSFVIARIPRIIVIVDSVTGGTTTITISIDHAAYNANIQEVNIHLEHLAANSTYSLTLMPLDDAGNALGVDTCTMTTLTVTSISEIGNDEEEGRFFPTEETEVYLVTGQYVGRYSLSLPPGVYIMREGKRWYKFVVGK